MIDTFFWWKAGAAFVGVIAFSLWFRAWARSEHEREMSRRAVKTDPRYIKATDDIARMVVDEIMEGKPSPHDGIRGFASMFPHLFGPDKKP